MSRHFSDLKPKNMLKYSPQEPRGSTNFSNNELSLHTQARGKNNSQKEGKHVFNVPLEKGKATPAFSLENYETRVEKSWTHSSFTLLTVVKL